MTIPNRALLVVLVVLACDMWAHVVAAQDEEDPELQRAVMLFEESEDAYNEGRFDEAAAMLRRAYAIHPDPLLLFNLARALEGEGDLEGAIENYELYIREAPDAEDRGAVEARLRTLREQHDRLASGDSAEAPEDELVEEGEVDDGGGGGGISAAPWIVTAGGLAIVAVGGVFGAMSQSRASEAETEPVQVTAKAIHDEASTFATLANVFIVVGAIATVGGVVWGVLDLLGDDEDEAEADLALVPGGVVVSGRF